MKKLHYIFLLLPLLCIGQSTDQNYVRTMTFTQPVSIYTETPAAQLADSAAITITYLDGLGRPKQQVAHKQGTGGTDIITHIEYNALGQQTKQFLPYIRNTASLAFDGAAEDNQEYFYDPGNTALPDMTFPVPTLNPYSETLFEASPLKRPIKQAAPGEDWAMASNHTIRTAYETNTETDVPIQLFGVATTWVSAHGMYAPTLTQLGTYLPAQLYKTVVKDENWTSSMGSDHTTEEFKNALGQVVLKRTYESGNPHDTYYVYDDYGNLTYVVPPLVDASATISEEIRNGLCYQYKYDYRNRMVEKKLPGKQWEYIVYDVLDRVVATGPVFDPRDGQVIGWIITKYDAYGRVIYTAFDDYAPFTSTTRKTYKLPWDNSPVLHEGKSSVLTMFGDVGIKYGNLVNPNATYLLTVNYYDDYDFANAPDFPATIEGVLATTKTKGMATGSWLRVPKTGVTLFESGHTLYDARGRVIRTHTRNHIGGHTTQNLKLNYTGQPLIITTEHKRKSTDDPLITTERFEYDAQLKPLTALHAIGSEGNEMLSTNTYDKLGQLITKRVGGDYNVSTDGLQKVDYKYNVRGWLTDINSIASLDEDTGQDDLFSFGISYEEPQEGIAGVEGLYNGNISETYWRTANDGVARMYGYTYDALNRFLTGTYRRTETVGEQMNSYGEMLTYDKNGNIQTLVRNGMYDDTVDYLEMDLLAYEYDTHSGNRLLKVTDDSNDSAGFDDDSDGTNDLHPDYAYDANGNMVSDENKDIMEITYNHLNLPLKITFGGEVSKKIEYLYDAAGIKVQKMVTDDAVVAITDYLGGYQYVDGLLQYFPTAEGYVKHTVSDVSHYNYVYNYTDHLGNIRLSYTWDETEQALAILEENNYYPFGLKHSNYNFDQKQYEDSLLGGVKLEDVVAGEAKYNYKYNGKEFQDELGLNFYDYGARNYDPAIGRWFNIDPFAEKFKDLSPYNYCVNNPVYFIDPDGMQATYNWETGKYMDGDKEVSFEEALASYDEGPGDPPPTEAERLSELVTIKGKKYHKNTNNVFASIGNTVNSWFGGDDDYFVEHKPYDKADDSFMQEAVGTSAGYLTGGVVVKVGGKALGVVAGSTTGKATVITVGRWMSKAEYAVMVKTGRMVEGAGGQTFVSTGGSGAFNAAAKGSVYAEFQVSTNNLLQGGQSNWFKAIGPTANISMKSALQKQGGQVLPSITNLTPILKVK